MWYCSGALAGAGQNASYFVFVVDNLVCLPPYGCNTFCSVPILLSHALNPQEALRPLGRRASNLVPIIGVYIMIHSRVRFLAIVPDE